MRNTTPLNGLASALLNCWISLTFAAAQEPPAPAPLESRVKDLEEEVKALRAERSGRAAVPGELPAEPAVEVQPLWDREELQVDPAMRGVYDKPFLLSLWRRAYVGGYTELEYHAFEDGPLGIPEGFRMHRTNLFIYGEVSDRIRFGSELEFETEFEGEPSSDIAVAVEMAFIDWTLFEELKIRGGALLVPLGRINVNHDGPVRDLTERPLVSTFVIPTTFTEPGIGAVGSIPAGGGLTFGYEAYLVNGFAVLDENGGLAADLSEREQLLRESRSSLGGDVNGDVAGTGRLSLRALGRIEAAASFHVGTYDEKSDNLLGIFAGDLAWVEEVGPVKLSFEGEIAAADFKRDGFARGAGVPDRFWGYYAQGSVAVGQETLQSWLPRLFEEKGASAGLVLRWDWVDLDGDEGSALEPGVFFRPIADTVFKASYRFAPKSVGQRSLPGTEHFDDEGFVFSLSSYF